jgi:hypothetical protein
MKNYKNVKNGPVNIIFFYLFTGRFRNNFEFCQKCAYIKTFLPVIVYETEIFPYFL